MYFKYDIYCNKSDTFHSESKSPVKMDKNVKQMKKYRNAVLKSNTLSAMSYSSCEMISTLFNLSYDLIVGHKLESSSINVFSSTVSISNGLSMET